MDKDFMYRIAKALERETEAGNHTQQTADVLTALRNVALRLWADMPEPEAK